jgi:hypothetical protein
MLNELTAFTMPYKRPGKVIIHDWKASSSEIGGQKNYVYRNWKIVFQFQAQRGRLERQHCFISKYNVEYDSAFL